jgi:hypothetical protein
MDEPPVAAEKQAMRFPKQEFDRNLKEVCLCFTSCVAVLCERRHLLSRCMWCTFAHNRAQLKDGVKELRNGWMHGVALREDKPTADELFMFARFYAPFAVWQKATACYTPHQYTSSAKDSWKSMSKWFETYFRTEVKEATKLAADPAAFTPVLVTFIDEHLLFVCNVCNQPEWLPGGDAGVAEGAGAGGVLAGGAANAHLLPPQPLHPHVDPEIAFEEARAVVWDEALAAARGNPPLTAALQRLRATEQLRQAPAIAALVARPVAAAVATTPVPAVSGGNHTHKYVEVSARLSFFLSNRLQNAKKHYLPMLMKFGFDPSKWLSDGLAGMECVTSRVTIQVCAFHLLRFVDSLLACFAGCQPHSHHDEQTYYTSGRVWACRPSACRFTGSVAIPSIHESKPGSQRKVCT